MASMQLQQWDWTNNEWKTIEEYDVGNDFRAEGNAYYAYEVYRHTGPHRLRRDDSTILGYDDPEDYYNAS